mmetsp:Transcript_15722/g.23938  ORF Transcript_15722/g.23938 Transcript_15722/m.23938 type:complete len:321 (+) Transcript_15722:78-1040(+)
MMKIVDLFLCSFLLISSLTAVVDAVEVEFSSISVGRRTSEGVTAGPQDGIVFAGEFIFGSINKINITTGEITRVYRKRFPFVRGAAGLYYDADTNLIFAAGLGTGFAGLFRSRIWVYDADTGDTVASCGPADGDFEAQFFNDVVAKDGYIYATDSVAPFLLKLSIADAALGECVTESIALPEEEFTGVALVDSRANGIVGVEGGLIVSSFNTGGFYFVKLDDLSVTQIASPEMTGDLLDGLLVYGDYLLCGQGPFIGVFDLDTTMEVPSIMNVTTIESSVFVSAATLAISGDMLVVADIVLGPGENFIHVAPLSDIFPLM